MSRRKRVDPLTKARIKRQSRCPDCSSTVAISRAGDQILVVHDDECPTLVELDEAGIVGAPVNLERPADMTGEQWDSAIATTARTGVLPQDQ